MLCTVHMPCFETRDSFGEKQNETNERGTDDKIKRNCKDEHVNTKETGRQVK